MMVSFTSCGNKQIEGNIKNNIAQKDSKSSTSDDISLSDSMSNLFERGKGISLDELFSTYEEILGNETSIELCDYTNLDLIVEKYIVTNEDVDAEIQYMLENAQIFEPVMDGIVEEDSIININFEGILDGKVEENLSSSGEGGTTFQLGTNAFIEGFEDGLIGKSPGDIIEEVISFPEDYGVDELNGKEASFTIKINYICGDRLEPEFTDEFISKHTKFNNIEEYQDYVREALQEYYDEDFSLNEDYYKKDIATQLLIENSTINSLNKEILYAYYNGMVDYYTSYADDFGYTMSAFCETFFGVEEDEFYSLLVDDAINYIVYSELLKLIGEKENITLSQDDYDNYLEELSISYGYESKDELLQEMSSISDSEIERLQQDALLDKILDYIVSIN